MAKKAKKAAKALPEPDIGSIQAAPNRTVFVTCQTIGCQAEFEVRNEPGKHDGYPTRSIICCPFCGGDQLTTD